ncbi:putative glycolipid-binding domain-containing protein [Planococcus dechangensis]|uniref:Glycolipid-binding domain-containing protein n=1 Tax=Planococcus dechangensis TaxID=1176255 RepID=A0ABV9MCR6_9BACL
MGSSRVMWENRDTFGCELLKLSMAEQAIHINSTVMTIGESGPIEMHYQLELDLKWKIKHVHMQSEGTALHLISTRQSEWIDENGKRMDALTGAIDIDISATPFTNSLPINRYDWKLGQARDFEMVYIQVPLMAVRKVRQTYILLDGKETRTFQYRSGDFQSVITVDEYGLVTNYPGLFTRRY